MDQYLSCVSPTFAGGPNDERLAGEERGAGCNQGNIKSLILSKGLLSVPNFNMVTIDYPCIDL